MTRLIIILLMFLPVISLAEETLHIQASDYPNGGGLSIDATDALILDTSGHVFSGAHGAGFGPPDTIAVHYMGDELKGYYSMPYTAGTKSFRIDATSLTPRNSPAFQGFKAGAAVFLMVGQEPSEGSLDMGIFADQWNLSIRVLR